MHQIFEGIDNEIVFIFFFVTLLLAVVIPLYVMKPNRVHEIVQNNDLPSIRQESTPASNDASSSSYSEREKMDDHLQNTHVPTEAQSIQKPVSSAQSSANDETSELISVRVLHQETYRQMSVKNNTKLTKFKELCFPDEFAAQKTIRMIHAGKILQGDTSPLFELGISNGAVIHCVISEPNDSDGRTSEPASIPNDLDISDYFMLLVGITLIGTWAIFITSSNIMSITSIAILGFLTVFFVGMTFYS